MKVCDLLNVLKCVDPLAEVGLEINSWEYRDKICVISSVETDTKTVKLHFSAEDRPEEQGDCDSCENS